jgi:Tol biopolymer transport system component/DNA-binding winged helix-turn-helix (wHTH) protein
MAVSKTKHRIWEFGPFRLDEAERQLLRDGEPIGMPPKVFDTLVTLLERSGRLVEKEALMERLWPDTFVEEGALTRNISDLRKALGEEKYVETVPKRGYRFVAPVREISDGNGALIVEKTAEARRVIKGNEEESPYTSSLPGRPPRTERNPPNHSLKTRLAMLLVGAVGIAGLAFGAREYIKSIKSSTETPGAFPSMRVSRFTASGNVVTSAISPDGKYIATVLNEDGLQSLWVRQVAAITGGVRLTAPARVEYLGLTFSNDSNFIYYVSLMRNLSDPELYQLPVLGGTPRRFPVENLDTPISFSPAGASIAYAFSSSSRGESYVKVMDIETAGNQTIVLRKQPSFLATYPGGPAWSPDGRFIAYAANGLVADDIQRMNVFVANVEDKAERQLTRQSWGEIGRVAWLGDGSGLVISAREQKDAQRQLWYISYPSGTARKITNDLHDYVNVSLSGDAKTLTAVQIQATFSISVTPQGDDKQDRMDLSHSREVFSEVSRGRERLAWTPDNRLVYSSRASGNWDIWLMNKDGSDRKQLTVDSHDDLFPAVSTDGRYIYFASDRTGSFNLWRLDINGGKSTQLTQGPNHFFPEVTTDGQWVIYQQGGLGPDEASIWRAQTTGGSPEQVSNKMTLGRLAQRPAISPDGKWLACVSLNEKGWGMTARSFDGDDASRWFPFPQTVGSRVIRWTPDGQALAYIVNEKGASNIWLQPLSGSPPRQLTRFTTGQLLTFAWSPDGQWLAYMRHSETSDVVLLRDFK